MNKKKIINKYVTNTLTEAEKQSEEEMKHVHRVNVIFWNK